LTRRKSEADKKVTARGQVGRCPVLAPVQQSLSGWVLAIDFGTSYTTVAIAEAGRVEFLDLDGVGAMPSGAWHDGAAQVVKAIWHETGTLGRSR
jgi:hypothetical protein